MLCVWWQQSGLVHYEMLKPGETVKTKRYQQQLTDLNRSLFEKTPEYQKKTTQNHFSSSQCTILYHHSVLDFILLVVII